jgi:membrane protein YdbS with pleckstrin-like domain
MASKDDLVQLEDGEKVLLEVRRHPFHLWNKGIFLSILFLVGVFLSPLITKIFDRLGAQAYGVCVTGFLVTLWALALWVVFFFQWTDYFLDVWIITDRRVFDVEQKGVFTRNISVTRLEQVQDVTIEVKGMLATFLKFGTIHIHTAGSEIDFKIMDAADPLSVKETIMKAHGETFSVRNGQPPQNITSQPQPLP